MSAMFLPLGLFDKMKFIFCAGLPMKSLLRILLIQSLPGSPQRAHTPLDTDWGDVVAGNDHN